MWVGRGAYSFKNLSFHRSSNAAPAVRPLR
jgi:hypothetical protein